MAPKAKKKDFTSEEEADRARSWPHLPQQLVDLIKFQPTLLQNISYKGVSKSGRTASKKCNPTGKLACLQLSNDSTVSNDRNNEKDNNTDNHDIYYLIFDRKEYWGKHCVGYSHGSLVDMCIYSKPSYFSIRTNPITGYGYNRHSPSWDPSVPFKCFVLSSSPPSDYKDPQEYFIVVLTGISHPALMYCRPGRDQTWTRQDCNIIDPYAPDQSQKQKFMKFTNAVGFRGKIYALSLQGSIAVIEEINSCLEITYWRKTRAVPSLPSKHFREFLFESDGQILLVFLISINSINVVDSVEVFRLKIKTLLWVKVESLGDRTLFMGVNCCMSILARKIGAKSNCVYFTHHNKHDDDGWWRYNMETGTISPCSSNEFRPPPILE